jgi:hypothetical protein
MLLRSVFDCLLNPQLKATPMKPHLPLTAALRARRLPSSVVAPRTRHGASRWSVQLLTAVVIAALGSVLLAVPAVAEDGAAVDCLIETGETAVLEGELAAIEQAGACGREVEVIDQRDEFGTVVALPSGELKAEIGVEPIQAQDESGQWAPIDTTLEIAADGTVGPVNITEDVAFSAGGSSPLATVDYGSEGAFALTWPGDLPVPVLAGPQAVYQEVLPGVDLVVEANAQGFRYDLVVADAEAAANPELEAIAFDIAATGVEVTDSGMGVVEISVAGQAEMISGQALMWEAPAASDGTEQVPDLTAVTDAPDGADQEIAAVEVALESENLVLRPDLELLRGEDTRYPVVIDPQWNGGIQGNIWGLVASRSDVDDSAFYRGKNSSGNYFMGNTSTYGNAGAGQTCDSWSGLDCYSSTYDMRSLFRMDTDTITQNAYKIPNKGLFKITQRHSASCSNGSARIYRTGGYNANDTWNTQPAWHESVTISSANNGATCDGSAYVSFNVTSMVKMADDNEWANLTLGLRAPDESPSPELLQWNRFDSYTAVLEIYYDVMPYAVSNRKLNGVFCTTSVENAPWTNSRTPRMSALYRSQDTTLKYQARLRSSTPVDAIVFDYTSGSLTSNKEYGNTLPSRYALRDGLYYWLARSFSTSNNSLASAWSPPCRFKVDGTKPSSPTVAPGTEAPYDVGETVNLTLSSTDPTVNSMSSGVVRFEYSWGTDNYLVKKSSTGTLTISSDDVPGMQDGLTAGRHVLYVRAVDAAGNISNAKTYTFFAGNDIIATPMATWRFEGDTADDSGHGFHLEPTAGTVSYTTDRDGRANGALALDGSTCLATDGPVIDTHAAFSVSAWIRVDSADGYDKALVQAGDAHSAFQIQYGAAEDKWYFSMLSSPGVEFEWKSVGAPATAALGEWQHVTGTYDPDAGLSRIYIDGALAGEMALDFEPWNGQGSMGVGCLLNPSGSTVNYVTGAMDQVGVWQGLPDQTQIQAAMIDLPTASVQAQWTFRNNGTDDSGYGRDLNTDGVPVGTDPYQRPSGAVELDGTACLKYPEPIVATDRSFTVAAWVRADQLSSGGAIVSTIGPSFDSGFELAVWNSSDQGQALRLDYMTGNRSSTGRKIADVPRDEWFHVTLVVDVPAGQVRTYIDGEIVDTWSPSTFPMLDSPGPVNVGCSYYPLDTGPATPYFHLIGSLHDVSLWRGVVDATQIATMMGDSPVEIASYWALDENGADWSGNNQDLTLIDMYSWVDGWEGTPSGAIEVNPTDGGYAYWSGPLVATDESFTFAAFVRADNVAADGVALSITGDSRSAITLKHSASLGVWQFAAPPSNTNPNWQSASSPSAPAVGEWTLIAGVFDLAKGELRLYVNGMLAGSATNVVMPAVTGRFVIGAEGNADGTTRNAWYGAVDDVLVWQGAVPEMVLAQMYNPSLVANPS